MKFFLWRKICLAHKENVFRYFNIVFCSFDTLIYYVVYEYMFIRVEYNKYYYCNWGVVSGLILQLIRYFLSWMLFFCIKCVQRKIVFRIWCYIDVLLIVILLVLILTEELHIKPLYYIVLIPSCFTRVYGLWIVYSFSLDTDIDFDPKVYYVKKEENVSASIMTNKNNNGVDCPTCNDNVEDNATNYSVSLLSLNSSRYYLPPV